MDASLPVSGSKPRVLHIAPGFDYGYIVPFYAMLASIFDYNRHHSLVIHIIGTGLPAEEREGIQQYVALNGGTVHLYEIDENFAEGFPDYSTYGHATFYRLLFPALLPADVDRFLYIDTDTIVTMDLGELFSIDLAGAPIAAVADVVMRTRPVAGIYDDGGYFNAGVLLIDRPQWLRSRISERAIEFMKNNAEAATFLDQDALNAILAGKWYKLDPKFNFLPDYIPRTLKSKEAVAFAEGKIVHFAQFFKPWHYLCNNRLRFLFPKYLKMTPKANAKFGTYKVTPNGYNLLFRLRARELYYDYPLVPLRLMDWFRGVSKK